MDEKKNKHEKLTDDYPLSLTGLMFVSVLEGYFMGDLGDYFDGLMPIWSKLGSYIGGLIGLMFINGLFYGIGVVISKTIRDKLGSAKKYSGIIQLVISLAVGVLLGGIIFSSCGNFGE